MIGLREASVTRHPFPFAVATSPLDPVHTSAIRTWMSIDAEWSHEDHGFYRNKRCTNLRSVLRSPAAVIAEESTIGQLREVVESLFDVELDRSHTRIVAHRLEAGDFIGRHNDRPANGTETHRVILHAGGDHVDGGSLLLGESEEVVEIAPRDGLLVAFPLSGYSFHQVTPVRAGIRDTVVYSFWSREPAVAGNPPSRCCLPTEIIALLEDSGAFTLRHRSKHHDIQDGLSVGDHLIAVAQTLRRWAVDEDVVRAGLLHSVYGPAGFSQQVISRTRRDAVRRVAGQRAEWLAFLFAFLDRDAVGGVLVDGTPVDLTATDLTALDHMVWANVIAQAHRLDWQAYLEPAEAAMRRQSLAPAARADIGAHVGRALTGS